MVSMETKMTDLPEESSGNFSAIAWIVVASFGLVLTAGAVAGFLGEHQAQGGGMISTAGIVALATLFAVFGGLCYAIWRQAQRIRISGQRQTSREKRSNRIIIVCGLIGGLLGAGLTVGSDLSGGAPDVFSNTPIDPAFAIGLALVVGVLMPLISWYWHNRVIDELEADAYRSGALIAVYAYWTLAPTWWVLWRGGLAPAPDGIAIYLVTIFTALVIWFWKKYR